MDVTIGLIGQGSIDCEEVRSRVRLSPNVSQHVQLKKLFAHKHSKVEIQLEANGVQGGSSANLQIDAIYLVETPSTLGRRVPDSQLTFPIANKVFRCGDHATALGLYLLLHRIRPLKIYGDNALMSARRLGMHTANTLEELMQIDE
jgi:hypothetical protein